MRETGDSPAAAKRTRVYRRSDGRVGRRERRAQTTLDFAIGMSIFLLTLTFVLVFVPGMLAPFSGGAQAETPAVNRVADELTQGTLGNASEPYVLDAECTAELFTTGAPATCNFDGATLAERVGVLERQPVNVTIRSDLHDSGTDSVLCWDAGAATLRAEGDTGCDTVLSGGSKPSGSGGKTVSARRVALLDGEDVTVEVVMW